MGPFFPEEDFSAMNFTDDANHSGVIHSSSLFQSDGFMASTPSAQGSNAGNAACRHCGTQIANPNAAFCNACGKSLKVKDPEITCSGCGKHLENKGAAFCPGCGAAVTNHKEKSPK